MRTSHPASDSIKMDKSPKVGKECEKPDLIALARLDVMRCLSTNSLSSGTNGASEGFLLLNQ